MDGCLRISLVHVMPVPLRKGTEKHCPCTGEDGKGELIITTFINESGEAAEYQPECFP